MIAPQQDDIDMAILDAELTKAVAKGLVTKSMTKAKKSQVLSRQDLIEREAIKLLRDKINKLKDEKRSLQKESSNLDIKLRKIKKRQKTLTEKEKEEMVESILGKHYSKAQIRCYVRGNWQMSKLWEERDYKLALIIHTISKRCFHYLRNHQVLPMPSYTSLKKHTFDESFDVKTATETTEVDALQEIQIQDEQHIVQIPSDQIEGQIQIEGTQIHIDGQSYTVEGQPFTLDGQQIQIAEGGQILTADGQLISQDGTQVTVMNVIDPSQLQELQAQVGDVVNEEEVHLQPHMQQVQYYVV